MSIPFTFSHYSLLRQCGRKFKYRVVDKLPEPTAVALEFGSALHAGINTALTDHDVDAAQDVFEVYWDGSVQKLDFSGERHNAQALKEMGVKFIANFYKRYGKDMKLLVGEKRMKAEYNYGKYSLPESLQTISVEGTPDALVSWNGKNVLLDFKSSAYNYEPIKTDMSLQLNMYAWLLEKEGYKVNQLCYVVFNKAATSIQTPYIKEYDSKESTGLIQEAVEYWLRNEGKYERNTTACVYGKSLCAYADKCKKEMLDE